MAILEISRPGHLKVGVRVLLCFTYHFAMPKFWKEICDGSYDLEYLAILKVGRRGRLKVGVRVLLCFTYCFAIPKFWDEICTFGEIGDHGNQLLGFLNSLGVWGVLRLDYVGDLLFLLPVF